MDSLRDQAVAFLKSARCIRKDEPRPSREELFRQYIDGKHRADPEFLHHVSQALEHARANAIVSDRATGPEGDGAYVYKRIAAILDGIQAEVLAERR